MGAVVDRPESCAVLVSIIIPLFGEEHYLTACLKAIDENTTNHEVIVVDNGTGYQFDADAIVRNPDNRNFGYACNQGSQIARSDLLCFLNVDTEVQPRWMEPLVAAFDDSAVAMAGPRIVHPDGTLQTAGGIRTWHGGGNAGGEELKIDGPSGDADGVTGACMMVRRDVFNVSGRFDLSFINGYEDVALCLSVREAGWRIRYVSESTIVHHESVAPGRWTHAHQNVATMNALWGNR